MTHTASHPFVTGVISKFSEWRKMRKDLRDLQDLGAEGSGRVADEIGVSANTLGELVRQGSRSAKELPELLTALNIDQQAIRESHHRLLADMERVCSACASKRRCNKDLANGDAPDRFASYCGNASTIESLTSIKLDL